MLAHASGPHKRLGSLRRHASTCGTCRRPQLWLGSSHRPPTCGFTPNGQSAAGAARLHACSERSRSKLRSSPSRREASMRQVRAHASSACRSPQAALQLNLALSNQAGPHLQCRRANRLRCRTRIRTLTCHLGGPAIAVGGSPRFFRRFLRFCPSRSPRRARKRPFHATLS